MEVPLLHNNGGLPRSRHPWMLYLSTLIAVCGSYEFGAWIGYSSPTQSAITQDLNLTTAEYALFGSILSFGAMLGAITSGTIADGIGRKWAMRVFSVVCAAGWLAIYFAQGALPLDIGRLAGGYGMGAFSYVIPVYIAEIAPVSLRGTLTTLNQLLIVTGVSVSFVIGLVLTWRVLALTGLIPCAILFFGLYLVPESPRWLAKRGYEKEFHSALQKLRGKYVDITAEADEIQDYIQQLEQVPKSNFLELFQRRYIRSLIIGIGLMICQQFGGINGVCFYISDTFESAGVSSTVGTITYAFIQVVVTAIGATLMDKAGRKPLVLVSATGLMIGSLLAAVGFYLKGHDVLVKAAPMLALTGLLVYVAAFSTGMGAVPWVVMSEIFPINVKGQAGSLATLINWFCSWTVSYTFSFLMSWSSYGTFLLFAAVNALAALFIIKMVPETKGKSLEQIQSAINE